MILSWAMEPGNVLHAAITPAHGSPSDPGHTIGGPHTMYTVCTVTYFSPLMKQEAVEW